MIFFLTVQSPVKGRQRIKAVVKYNAGKRFFIIRGFELVKYVFNSNIIYIGIKVTAYVFIKDFGKILRTISKVVRNDIDRKLFLIMQIDIRENIQNNVI